MFAMAFFIIGTAVCIYLILLAGAAVVVLAMAAGVVGCVLAALAVVVLAATALFASFDGLGPYLADDYHLPPAVAGYLAILALAGVWRINLYLRDR